MPRTREDAPGVHNHWRVRAGLGRRPRDREATNERRCTMNSVTKAGLRAMRRHPRKAVRVSLFALRHRTAVARGVRAARFASQLATAAKRGADDPKVKTEARAAITALAAAFGDARRA